MHKSILDILDVQYPKNNRPIDGISVLDALRGNQKERGKPIGFICKPYISWVTHQYKLIGDDSRENFELYDLLNDKSEKENIIHEFPQVAEQMKADLFDWLDSVEVSKKGKDYSY